MASGHVNRVNRPNTWLHRPMLQNVKKLLPTRSRPHMGSKLKMFEISSTSAHAITSTPMTQCVLAALRIATVIERAGRQLLSAVNPEFPRRLGQKPWRDRLQGVAHARRIILGTAA